MPDVVIFYLIELIENYDIRKHSKQLLILDTGNMSSIENQHYLYKCLQKHHSKEDHDIDIKTVKISNGFKKIWEP